MTRQAFLYSLLLLLTVLFASVPVTADSVSISNGLTAAGGPLAVHGYDVVSYHGTDAPQRGLAAHSVLHDGVVYRFASKKNRRQFASDPEKFLPQFGGFCAYGVSVGKKFDGDPLVYKVVDGKLYFNLNPEIKSTWEKDVAGNIEQAEDLWPGLRSKAAASL